MTNNVGFFSTSFSNFHRKLPCEMNCVPPDDDQDYGKAGHIFGYALAAGFSLVVLYGLVHCFKGIIQYCHARQQEIMIQERLGQANPLHHPAVHYNATEIQQADDLEAPYTILTV